MANETVVAMLHNQKMNKWHPIIFVPNPLPGGSDTVMRYKSTQHHTEGFESRTDALSSIEDDEFKSYLKFTENDIPWTGEGVPALVCFRAESGLIFL